MFQRINRLFKLHHSRRKHSRMGRPLRLERLEGRQVLSLSYLPALGADTGESPMYHAVADFDRDGRADVAVANYGESTVSIFRGNGDGTFAPRVNYPAASPFTVTATDLNGDSRLDLVVPSTSFPGGSVSILLGNGDGTFQSAVSYGTGITPYSATPGDFNADGRIDLAVALGADENGTNNVNILLGDGNGSLQNGGYYRTGGSTQSLVVHDFNDDGRLDLAAANASANFQGAAGADTVGILLGNGDGTFASPVIYPTPDTAPNSGSTMTYNLAKADLNADGRMDLLVSHYLGDSVSVLLGNGDGTFDSAVNYATGLSDSHSLAVADFDGDGRTDVALVGFVDNDRVSILLGNGDGSLQSPQFLPLTGSALYSVSVGDFNGDLQVDLSVIGNASRNLSVLLNDGGGIVNPLVPTIVVDSNTVQYDGQPHAASALAVGADGVTPISGSFSFTYNGSPDLPTDAGIYDVVAEFTSSDVNYGSAIGSGRITIDPASPSVSLITGYYNYDGQPHGATASAFGVDGVTPVSGTILLTYSGSTSPPTDAGEYTVVATFNSADPNYTHAATSGTLVIVSSSPSAQIGLATSQVANLVSQGQLNRGNGNALISKLAAATASLSEGQTRAATSQLNAFINQVNALRKAKKLTNAAAQSMIDTIQQALATL